MELKFFNVEELDRNIKCSIHSNGKLGFSESASKKLDLDTSKSIALGINEEDNEEGNLYAVVFNHINTQAFKVSRAGEYYYLNTKPLFDKLGIKYREKRIIYDIIDFEHDGEKMYKLIKRELPKKK